MILPFSLDSEKQSAAFLPDLSLRNSKEVERSGIMRSARALAAIMSASGTCGFAAKVATNDDAIILATMDRKVFFIISSFFWGLAGFGKGEIDGAVHIVVEWLYGAEDFGESVGEIG